MNNLAGYNLSILTETVASALILNINIQYMAI